MGCMDFLKKEISKRRFIVILATLLVMMIVVGWILALLGCKTRTYDITKHYSFCAEISNEKEYYGGLTLLVIGVMSLFGWAVGYALTRQSQKMENSSLKYEGMEGRNYEDEPLKDYEEEKEEKR